VCEVILHWGLDLHFPDDWWYSASFSMPMSHLYIFFRKMFIQVFDFSLLSYEFFIYSDIQ
jgi:hypothetical protein